jgi:hypothetical protein
VSRNLPTALETAVSSEHVGNPLLFAELDFASGFVRCHSGLGTINWGGNDWLGVGTFGTVSQLDESAELAKKTTVYTLTGIPNSVISLSLNDYYQGRSAKLYFGVIGDNGDLVSEPILIDQGLMDVADSLQGETCNVSITSENRFALWERPQVRRYTDEDQRARFPDDTGLRYIDQAASKEIYWGRKSEV